MAEVIEEKKNEKLEELKRNVETAKEKKKEYMRTHDYCGRYLEQEVLDEFFESGQLDRFFNNSEEFKVLCENYNKCIRELDFYNLWNKEEFKPIRNQIEEYKKEVGFVDGVDLFEYQLVNKDDKYFFGFVFTHYNGKRYYYADCPGYYDKGLDCVYGYILYDKNGHVYMSHKGFNDKGYTNHVTRGIEKDSFMYSQKFVDDEYMYFREERECGKLYKFTNGEYELVYDFGNSYPDFPPVLWDRKLVMVDGTKLFSVKDKKYISDNKIGHLRTFENSGSGISYGYSDKLHDKTIDEEQKELISKYLKENNLLLCKKVFEVKYDGDCEEYQTILFVDMNGHIVSKLYVISSDTYECTEYDISDETYAEVFKTIKEFYQNKLETKVKREKAAKKAAETRRNKMLLKNQKNIFETMKAVCYGSNTDPMKMTYHPKDKKQEDIKE